MTLRFSPERYITALNLLLVGVLAYVLALAVNKIVLRSVSSGPQAGRFAVANAVPSAATHPRGYYDAIVHRDIFNLEPVAAPPPAKVATNLHIELLGTSKLTLSRPYIIVEDLSTRQQSLYRLGDDIPNAGKLVGVYKDSALIQRNGHRVMLKMPTQPGAPLSEGFDRRSLPGFPGRRLAARPPSEADGVNKIGPTSYVVKREALKSKLRNMASLFSQIRAIPNMDGNGHSDGFKLSEIQPGSIFQNIGLRDGDILTSVEGHQIENPIKAMQLLTGLQNRSSINLTVVRDGTPLQLHYNIR